MGSVCVIPCGLGVVVLYTEGIVSQGVGNVKDQIQTNALNVPPDRLSCQTGNPASVTSSGMVLTVRFTAASAIQGATPANAPERLLKTELGVSKQPNMTPMAIASADRSIQVSPVSITMEDV